MYSKQESPLHAPPSKNGTQISVWAFTKDMKSEFWDHSEVMGASFPLVPNVGIHTQIYTQISLGNSSLEYEPNVCNSARLIQNGLKLLFLKLGYIGIYIGS